MTKLGSALLAMAALMLCLGLATGAGATSFTLANTITLSDPNSDLEVILLPDSTVSGAMSCLSGTCTLTNNFVVFRVEVTHVSGTLPNVDEIGASVFAQDSIEGVGVFTAPSDVLPSSGSGSGSTQAIWDFDSPNLTDGDYSDPLFVTYNNDGLLLHVGEGSVVSFMVHPVGGVIYSSPPTTTLVIVPEPGTLALTAAMLLGLAALRSLRRRRA